MIAGISRRCPPLNGLFASQTNFQNLAWKPSYNPPFARRQFFPPHWHSCSTIVIHHVDYRLHNSHVISLKYKYLPLIRGKRLKSHLRRLLEVSPQLWNAPKNPTRFSLWGKICKCLRGWGFPLPQYPHSQVEIKSSLKHTEVLLGRQEVGHPVRLEPDEHHVGGELAQASQGQAGLGPLLEAVAFRHWAEEILVQST